MILVLIDFLSVSRKYSPFFQPIQSKLTTPPSPFLSGYMACMKDSHQTFFLPQMNSHSGLKNAHVSSMPETTIFWGFWMMRVACQISILYSPDSPWSSDESKPALMFLIIHRHAKKNLYNGKNWIWVVHIYSQQKWVFRSSFLYTIQAYTLSEDR